MPRITLRSLNRFLVAVFEKLGASAANSKIITEVLLSADRRGIASHGVARLDYYLEGIQQHSIDPGAEPSITKETPTTLLINGNGGMGQIISVKTMDLVIAKAKKMGMASAVIRNSNHYGIAGYCAMMALEHDLIGFSATNTPPFIVPTFGKDAALGTNPLAVAVPAGSQHPFVLDMATSTVALGKLEICDRLGKKIPEMWACDVNGNPTDDSGSALDSMWSRAGGGLSPLGGFGEQGAGYKGYDLAALVDIITGGLALSFMGTEMWGKHGEKADISHFLAAFDPAAFSDIEEFKKRMDSFITMLKNQPRLNDEQRIWVAGEKEWEAEARNVTEVDVDQPTLDKLRRIGGELGVPADF